MGNEIGISHTKLSWGICFRYSSAWWLMLYDKEFHKPASQFWCFFFTLNVDTKEKVLTKKTLFKMSIPHPISNSPPHGQNVHLPSYFQLPSSRWKCLFPILFPTPTPSRAKCPTPILFPTSLLTKKMSIPHLISNPPPHVKNVHSLSYFRPPSSRV